MRPVSGRFSTRAARGLSLLAVTVVALSGCSGGQPQPREYGEVNTENEGYYGNFMLGCTGVEANADGEYVNVEYGSEDYCTCVFKGMKETVTFDVAQEFEEAQAEAEDGSEITVPRAIREVMDDCDAESAQS
jgi:hypothetical protein